MHRRTLYLLIAVSVGVLLSASAAGAALLSVNGTFDAGLNGWATTGDVRVVSSDTFQGLSIDRPGRAPFVRLDGGAAIAQTIDLTGATRLEIAFDYRVAAWDQSAGSGSSAPGFSESPGRPLELWIGPKLNPFTPTASVLYDDPWDGTCTSPPGIPLPTCSDGTPSESGWRHFSQVFVAPSIPFGPDTRIEFLVGTPWSPTYYNEFAAIYLDDVTFTTNVPEPTTMALVLLGLAGASTRLRRRV